ncbi:MAG: dihydropteroate synthase [Anaerolineae bacterium]|nr:dihydropteroate synthase [Anaerolineae bacterium]
MKSKDKRAIQELAAKQVEAGAEMLSIDLGPEKKKAAQRMEWLVDTVQEAVDIPLALRSADPAAIEAGLKKARQQVLVNATSPAVTGFGAFIEIAAQYGAKLALAACAGGVPTSTEARIELIIENLVPQALEAGIPLRNLYIDPFVTALTCDQPQAPNTVNTLRLLKVAAERVPNTLAHLGDISDGVSADVRGLVNRTYLVMLMGAGLDAVVMDPLDAEARAFMRIVKERDGRTPLSRLLLRLHDVTAAEAELDISAVDKDDPRQVAVYKTVQILTNQVVYADSYLGA